MNSKGFTLLELLTVISIVGILYVISYPSYTNHVLNTRRTDAEVALLSLASGMENYYAINNTYLNATLKNIGINEYTENNYYHLEISSISENNYLLKAIPLGTQTEDKRCGTLSLDNLGNKNISGTATLKECWNL